MTGEFVSPERFRIPRLEGGVIFPSRVAALLWRDLAPLRKRWRDRDTEVSAALQAVHLEGLDFETRASPSVSDEKCPASDTSRESEAWELTASEVAGRLGVDVRTVTRWAQRGRLAGTKRAGRWRFPRDVINRFEETHGRH